jgi:polygalacturonase
MKGIKVYNHANYNNDMMDIDGCKYVIISDCFGNTDDDGITLKSTSNRITENGTITNCVISRHCNAIKLDA